MASDYLEVLNELRSYFPEMDYEEETKEIEDKKESADLEEFQTAADSICFLTLEQCKMLNEKIMHDTNHLLNNGSLNSARQLTKH